MRHRRSRQPMAWTSAGVGLYRVGSATIVAPVTGSHSSRVIVASPALIMRRAAPAEMVPYPSRHAALESRPSRVVSAMTTETPTWRDGGVPCSPAPPGTAPRMMPVKASQRSWSRVSAAPPCLAARAISSHRVNARTASSAESTAPSMACASSRGLRNRRLSQAALSAAPSASSLTSLTRARAAAMARPAGCSTASAVTASSMSRRASSGSLRVAWTIIDATKGLSCPSSSASRTSRWTSCRSLARQSCLCADVGEMLRARAISSAANFPASVAIVRRSLARAARWLGGRSDSSAAEVPQSSVSAAMRAASNRRSVSRRCSSTQPLTRSHAIACSIRSTAALSAAATGAADCIATRSATS
jgi:hypothetical protein